MEPTERPARPWAAGIGLLLLGLFVSAISSTATWASAPGGATRALGWAGYAAGVVVAGVGVHRLLWFRPTRLGRGVRLLVTALVTPLAFAAGALFFSLIFTIIQLRFPP